MQNSNDDHTPDSPDDFVRDVEEDAQKAFRRMVVASTSGPTMKRFAAAAALAIAGKRGRDMRAPEPLVQAGFEPSEEEMALIVDMAEQAGRDLIHVSCHDDGSGKPTGIVSVVYFDAGKARPHRRGGLLCAPGGKDVFLGGVSDEEDEVCHFIFSPGKKLVRVPGYATDDLGAAMNRGGQFWLERAQSLEGADCSDEVIRIPGVLQGPGGPARRLET